MRTGALVLHGDGPGAVPVQAGVGGLTGMDPPAETLTADVPVGAGPAGVLVLIAVDMVIGRAGTADTVRVTVRMAVTVLTGPITVLVGPATVAVTVTAGRGLIGRTAGAVIGRVEAAGSEWPAPPITTPATRPAAAASVTGRRHQFPEGSTMSS